MVQSTNINPSTQDAQPLHNIQHGNSLPTNSLCAAAANTTDASQLGTVQITDGAWVNELPTAWRSHMSEQLIALGRQDRPSVGASRNAGLWATPAAVRSVPLDQGSVNGIMQHVSNEQVRRQVCEQLHCSIIKLCYLRDRADC